MAECACVLVLVCNSDAGEPIDRERDRDDFILQAEVLPLLLPSTVNGNPEDADRKWDFRAFLLVGAHSYNPHADSDNTTIDFVHMIPSAIEEAAATEGCGYSVGITCICVSMCLVDRSRQSVTDVCVRL
jgi:hypothetical protein